VILLPATSKIMGIRTCKKAALQAEKLVTQPACLCRNCLEDAGLMFQPGSRFNGLVWSVAEGKHHWSSHFFRGGLVHQIKLVL
jgi:hypothetical protein